MKIIYIFIIFVLLFAFLIPKSAVSATEESSQKQKYFILKIDDVGIDFWDDIINTFISHPNYVGDFGIIGNNFKNQNHLQELIQQLLLTNRSEIFDHGWDHFCPEFANRSLSYQINHIQLWDNLIKNLYNLTTFVLGTPCNQFDYQTYYAMNNTNYKVLFFSTEAGLQLKYLYADTFSLLDIKKQLIDLSDEQTIFCQVHLANTLYWKSITNVIKFLDMVYATGRIGITMTDYYNQIYAPANPNYFLTNSSSFLAANVTTAGTYAMPIPVSQTTTPPEIVQPVHPQKTNNSKELAINLTKSTQTQNKSFNFQNNTSLIVKQNFPTPLFLFVSSVVALGVLFWNRRKK